MRRKAKCVRTVALAVALLLPAPVSSAPSNKAQVVIACRRPPRTDQWMGRLLGGSPTCSDVGRGSVTLADGRAFSPIEHGACVSAADAEPLLSCVIARGVVPVVRGCFADLRKAKPDANGDVSFLVTTDDAGHLEPASRYGTSLDDPRTVACVEEALRGYVLTGHGRSVALVAFRLRPYFNARSFP